MVQIHLLAQLTNTKHLQTFLPYEDFAKSAKVLDQQRLGKQRVETYQILKVLIKLKKHPNAKPAWYHHPAVMMWQGYENLLCNYGIIMCTEWKARGFEDSLEKKFVKFAVKTQDTCNLRPSWLGNSQFHLAHRSNLLRKNKKHYRKFWPKLTSKLEYVWPVRIGDN